MEATAAGAGSGADAPRPQTTKRTLKQGREAPPRAARYNTVCHVDLYRGRDAELVRSTRGSAPQAFFLGADPSLGALEPALRSMAVGERALIATGTGPDAKVLDVEVLAVRLPSSSGSEPSAFREYSEAWWTWFEDPVKWRPLPVSGPGGSACATCTRCGSPDAAARCGGCREAHYCSKPSMPNNKSETTPTTKQQQSQITANSNKTRSKSQQTVIRLGSKQCQREDWLYHRPRCRR
ncbi:unnamed protein product [Polarella glacialis]|uniref:Uncharacterized protein n=1 Tax=Polarella glacialis TaxID=89957 RepID=A0A813LC79_POLGL|nr:unnamed protein product [Polarella glacialis]